MIWKRSSKRPAGSGSSGPDRPANPLPSGRPVVLIAGSSRGIGRDVALAFAHDGFDVVLGVGAASGAQAEVAETAAAVRAAGVDVLTVPMDLRDGASVLAAAARILGIWGRVDVLVNNARTSGPGHYRHQLALIQRLLPTMVAGGSGVVVNLLSSPDRTAQDALDAASQDAFRRLTDTVNGQYRAIGVRAFNLGPDELLADPGRGVDPTPAELVAAAAVWLATDSDADRFLGKEVWVPKRMGTLAA